MKRLLIRSAIVAAMLTVVLIGVLTSWASINLNSSRSNIYRIAHTSGLVKPEKLTAMLAALDELGPSDEVTLNRWLRANFQKFGIDATQVKLIKILREQPVSCSASVGTCKGRWAGPALNARTGPNAVCYCYEPVTSPSQVAKVNKASPIRILLLTDSADEPQALAVSDPGKQGIKGTKDVP